MVKWFKSLSRQEKVMLLLILVLLIGVILRWDNVKRKALIWFRADELVERQADSGRFIYKFTQKNREYSDRSLKSLYFSEYGSS